MGFSETYEVECRVRLSVQASDPEAAVRVGEAQVAQAVGDLMAWREACSISPGCWVWVPGAAARELLGVAHGGPCADPELLSGERLEAPGTLVLLALALMAARQRDSLTVRGGGVVGRRLVRFAEAMADDSELGALVATLTREAEDGAFALAYQAGGS